MLINADRAEVSKEINSARKENNPCIIYQLKLEDLRQNEKIILSLSLHFWHP